MVNVRIVIRNLAINGPAFAETIELSAALVPADLSGMEQLMEAPMAKAIICRRRSATAP